MSRDKEKAATEDHRSLDIRALHRAGLLRAGYACNWEWKRQAEVIGTIGIEAESLIRLRLRYRVISRGETDSKEGFGEQRNRKCT